MKPSLLIIAHTYAVPEHAKKLPELARHFELTCATVQPRYLGAVYGTDIPPRDPAQLSWTHLELPAHGRVPFTTTAFLGGLSKIIRSRAWDYVLVENEPWSFVKWQTLLACRLPGSRVRYYGEFTWENVLRPGLKGCILSLVYRLTACWADFWVCGNQAAARIVQHYGTAKSRTIICPQIGVDTASFHPVDKEQQSRLRTRFGLCPTHFIIGFAGRFVQEKGVLDLIQAVDALEAHHHQGESPVQVALMGQGHLRESLLKAAQTRPWLKVLPPLPHDEIQTFLQCLDILSLGSHPLNRDGEVWEEQFGHVLIEAIACGALAIGSTSGAIPEVLGDSELLFAPGDVSQLSQLLSRLHLDSHWLTTKKAAATARLHEHHTHAAVADQLARSLLALPRD